MAGARGVRASQQIRDEISAWVARELAKPEAQKEPTQQQRRVVGDVLANHYWLTHARRTS